MVHNFTVNLKTGLWNLCAGPDSEFCRSFEELRILKNRLFWRSRYAATSFKEPLRGFSSYLFQNLTQLFYSGCRAKPEVFKVPPHFHSYSLNSDFIKTNLRKVISIFMYLMIFLKFMCTSGHVMSDLYAYINRTNKLFRENFCPFDYLTWSGLNWFWRSSSWKSFRTLAKCQDAVSLHNQFNTLERRAQSTARGHHLSKITPNTTDLKETAMLDNDTPPFFLCIFRYLDVTLF